MSKELSRREHAALYGPTTGDAVRLADTGLFAQIERDLTRRGDEAVFGGGKVIRDGMGHNGQRTRDEDIPDTVITNAIIIDHTGVYKADVAIRDGVISAIGAAGNPDIMDDVDIVIGASTEVIAGEHRILTAGGIDSHIHFISPAQVATALASGVTTMIGGGTGPADGTNATTITPGAWNLARMLQAVEDFPMNIGLLGKGHASAREPLAEQLRAGAVGFKIHEDWGATHAVIDEALAGAVEAALPGCIGSIRSWQAQMKVLPEATALIGVGEGATMALAAAMASAGDGHPVCGRVSTVGGRFGPVPDAVSPTLVLHLVHGKADQSVHFRHSVKTAEDLVKRDADVMADIVPHEGHALSDELVGWLVDRLQSRVPRHLWQAAMRVQGAEPGGDSCG